MVSSNTFRFLGVLLLSLTDLVSATQCRALPGDAAWPSQAQWNAFKTSVGGNLISTVPIASVCHNDSSISKYDANKCAALQANWFDSYTHVKSSSSIMAPYFTDQSCDPFTAKDAQCVVGSYVQYAVKATCTSDFQKTLAFATKHNLRLVVRNTGHDYHGKSTGAGALALWTANLKDINVIRNYRSSVYNGPAIKMAAGVLVEEANAAAQKAGLVVVTGNCPTVGVAGGYTQGGGHGPLTSAYGLSADNVLEWEVVTATGKILTATPTKNTDLYWALSGGGGGTYGVVVSVTIRAHPDKRTSAANLAFALEGISQDLFLEGVGAFISSLPPLVDQGVFAIWLLTPVSFGMNPATAPGLSKAELDALMQPLLKKLTTLGITYSYEVYEFPTYLDSYKKMNPPIAVNNVQMGGRFIPRSFAEPQQLPKLLEALKTILNAGAIVSGLGVNANKTPVAPNSVNPEWRKALFLAVVGTMWDNTNMELNIANQGLITNTLVPALTALTPGGGAYLNEADFRQPDFPTAFYSTNYAKLRSIKLKYDPKDIFYGRTAVGSDEWTTESADKRLCRSDVGPNETSGQMQQMSWECTGGAGLVNGECAGEI